MRLLSNLLKDSAIYGGADLLGKLVVFLLFPYLAALMSVEDMGYLELLYVTAALVGFLVRGGINNAIQRYYWADGIADDQRRILVGTGLSLVIAYAATLLFFVLVFGRGIVEVAGRNGVNISMTGLISVVLLSIATQLNQFMLDLMRLGFERAKYLWLNFYSRILVYVGSFGLVAVGLTRVDGFILSLALGGILFVPLGYWFIKHMLQWKIDRQMARQIFWYGFPFIFVDISYWLFSSLDRWMLASMSGMDSVGEYAVAWRLSSIVMFVSTAFGLAWSPYAIKLKTDYPERYKKIYAEILILLYGSFVLLAGAVSIFSGELLSLLFSGKYDSIYFSLIVLVFTVALQSTHHVFALGISLEGKTVWFPRLALMAVCINAGLNYMLLPIWGANGASVATLCSYLFLTCAYYYVSGKLHPVNFDIRSIYGWSGVLVLLFGLAIALHSAALDIRLMLMKFGLLTAIAGACIWSMRRHFRDISDEVLT